MGDNLVPIGLSGCCKVIYSKVDPVDPGCGLCVPPWLHGTANFCSAHAAAVNPARAAPLRASGVDRDGGAEQRAAMPRMHKSASGSECRGEGWDIGEGLRAEWVVERLQGLLLEIEISEIVVHEADEPNAVIDFLDAELLTGQHGRDVDPFAMQAEATASGDDDVAIVEGIGQFRQAA